jgi:hypothetical protein
MLAEAHSRKGDRTLAMNKTSLQKMRKRAPKRDMDTSYASSRISQPPTSHAVHARTEHEEIECLSRQLWTF